MISLLLAALVQQGGLQTYVSPIADTYLAAEAPSTNYGREGTLKGGPGKAILIDFPGLTLQPGAIGDASLILNAVSGLGAELESVALIRTAWRQGTGGKLVKSDQAAALQGATWTQRGGDAAWEMAGASGGKDVSELENLSAGWSEDKLVITGLGPALREMQIHPDAYFGLRLQFGQPCEFVSAEDMERGPAVKYSQAPSVASGADAPQVLEIKPGAGGAWQAAVVVPVDGTLVWRMDGIEFARSSVKGGPEQTVTATPPAGKNLGLISVEIEAGQKYGSYATWVDAQPISISGQSFGTVRTTIDRLNREIFPFSYSAFTPGGVRQRLRLTRDAGTDLKAVVTSAEAHVMAQEILKALVLPNRDLPKVGDDAPKSPWSLTGDTRDDSQNLVNLPIPDLGWMPRFDDVPETPLRGMIGRFEMGALERLHNKSTNDRGRFKLPIPTNLFLRCFDYSGKELQDTAFKIWKSDTNEPQGSPILDTKNSDSNVLVAINGEVKNLVIDATRGGLTVRRVIPWTRLADEGMRIGEGLGSLEIRFPISSQPINTTRNQAKGAMVLDSAKSAPVRLISVTDEKPETGLDIPANSSDYWIEVDLGRDMRVAEVQLSFAAAVPDFIDVQLYQTGEKPDWAVSWVRDRGASLRAQSGTVTYRSEPYAARYVRLRVKSPAAIKLNEIRVYDIIRA